MIEQQWDADRSVLTVRPLSPLSTADFDLLATSVDAAIERRGDLHGLIIDAPHFPGWNSFGAVVKHIHFVRDHHKHISKIAVITDSPVGSFAPQLVSHVVAPQIRRFRVGQIKQAAEWVADAGHSGP